MNVYEFMFVVQFWLVIVILGVKVYNVMRAGDFMNVIWCVLSFCSYFVCWAVAFVVLLSNPEEVLYIALFKFETWLMLLVVVLFVAELFLLWKTVALKPTEAYNALEVRKLGLR